VAIKDRKDKSEALKAEAMLSGAPQRNGPNMLTPEEGESILRMLSAQPEPLTPEIKRAIANFKRIKAERIL